MKWIVCQIGAREHYAIPRALHAGGVLAELITDFWMPPGFPLGRVPALRRLRDRYHPALHQANVYAPNAAMLGGELLSRVMRQRGWPEMRARNARFQAAAIKHLSHGRPQDGGPRTLFSYSYAARDLFRFAKTRGWRTVLGQIDPGPEEERIVAEEHQRYPHLGSTWQPAPARYWDEWREELALADVVVVNSGWSRDCLLKSGVAAGKIRVIPLVYEEGASAAGAGLSSLTVAGQGHNGSGRPLNGPLKVLFLGQINLRKGVARLLDAMRLLKEDDVELTLVGPTEIDPEAWADLPKVRWTGPVPRSEAADYYREADVFILPTLSDGYALTQLEALAYGLPVIASRCCGEAVKHGINGLVLLRPEAIEIREAILGVKFPYVQIAKNEISKFTLSQLNTSLQSSETSGLTP
jgi:glycosyltransferase involved in cell wall biosynthesis